jgi:hypothetical protein
MIRQSHEDVGEPSLRIDVVELGGMDQRIDRGGAAAAVIGPGRQGAKVIERSGSRSRNVADPSNQFSTNCVEALAE